MLTCIGIAYRARFEEYIMKYIPLFTNENGATFSCSFNHMGYDWCVFEYCITI